MKTKCFLRGNAGSAVDVFDDVVAAERRGDAKACALLDALDRVAQESEHPPDSGMFVRVAVQAGWFEDRSPALIDVLRAETRGSER